MSIPTGADYHILKAKSAIDDAWHHASDAATIRLMLDALGELVKAMELMQQEKERKEQ